MSDRKVIHLANVLAIAEADGAVDSAEEAVFEVVAARLGADAADVAAARTFLAQNRPYRLRAFNDPAASMAVIEDMVMMSMADGRVKPQETRPLEAFFESLGYVQADIDMVVRRVQRRMSKFAAPAAAATVKSVVPPPLAGTEGVAGVKRPPAVQPQAQEVVPEAEVVRESTAERVAEKRAEARTMARVKEVARQSRGKTAGEESVGWGPPEPFRLSHEEEPKGEAIRKLSGEIKAVAEPEQVSERSLAWQECAKRREVAAEGECYCFGAPEGPLNPWGCRLAEMPWQRGVAWLRLGSFRTDGAFVFDHGAMADALDSALKRVVECPYLRPHFVEAALAVLPSRGIVGGHWEAYEAVTGAGGFTLEVVNYNHGCGNRRTVVADGLSPLDDHMALLMIRRAARRTGIDVDVKLLVDLREEGEQ